MKSQTMNFLREYVDKMSPSGYEGPAAKLWKNEASKFSQDVFGDFHGNSFAVVGKGNSPRVMLAGHTDEIGVMISKISEAGYLYFDTIGGWDNQILPGQRVRIRGESEEILGVVGKKPVHLMEDEEKKNVVKVKDLWIDIGAEDKEEAESLVSVGSPGVLDYGFRELRGNKLTARGFDDKIGGFIVLEAARKVAKKDCASEVTAVATVQEEIGLRGAQTSAHRIDPQIGIAVDVGFATDSPKMDAEEPRVGEVNMGDGPILTRGPNINPRLFDRIVKTAESEDIPYQIIGNSSGTGTDANAMQLSRDGVATGLISVPNRYMHSPGEIVSVKDVENIIDLIAETIVGIEEEDFELFE